MWHQQIPASRRQTLVALIGLVILAGLVVRWEPGAAVSSPMKAPGLEREAGADEVIARLPAANRDPQLRRAAHQKRTANTVETLALAARYLETLRRDGDSQLGGFTESLLLGEDVRSEPRAMLLRADLYQFQHRFSEAESLLSRLREMNKGGTQTWLLSANLARVQGRLADAGEACARAGQPLASAWSVLCKADLAILAGDPKAYQAGMQMLAELPGKRWEQDPVAAVWLGDMADRVGRVAQAEQHFRRALLLGPGPYAVDRYFRFLIDQQQPGRAERILNWWLTQRDQPSMPDLLNQAQLASIQGNRIRLAALEREFDRLRRLAGGQVHWREMTRFSLIVTRNSGEALANARENWRTQKEPIDAFLFARAARLAGSKKDLIALSEDLSRRKLFGVLNQLNNQGLI